MAYQYEVAYADHSSMMGGGKNNLTETAFEAGQYAALYQSLGYPLRQVRVYLTCSTCNGLGHKQYKRLPAKYAQTGAPKCVKCEGSGISESHDLTHLVNQHLFPQPEANTATV